MKSDNFPTPAVNVDGTPMVSGGVIDVEGKPFGVTECVADDTTSACIADDFTSSSTTIDDSCSSFDSGFDSDFGTSFDDGF